MNPSLEPFTEPYLILTIIVVSGLIAYSIIIELVLAFVFQLKSKKAILNILFINFITQGLMYIYFLIIFDAYESQYFFHLYIYEAFVLIVEFLYLYWRLKPTYTWKHIALFVIVSNIVSYLLGIIRYY
jgi:predicted permease